MDTNTDNSVPTTLQEDVWIPSTCSVCYNQCGIRVHRVNGTVVKIEGNPDSPVGMGRLCPKGLAGIMMLYDPNRLNVPLKRTNPRKGIGIDPGWQEISWEEALEIITDKLRRVRQEDPRRLMMTGCIPSLTPLTFGIGMFMPAFGSSNVFISNGHQCGNAEHLLAGTLHAAVTTNPDLDYCNYLLMFGCHCGTAAYYAFTTMAQKMADARARGMKLVVVDPMLNAGAEKADEWLPIRPGTDGALALAILHVLLNELGLYDAQYLKHHTNAPYLLQPDGTYRRDAASGKPLVWDAARESARPYDAEIQEYALEGSYQVDGVDCQPAFARLKRHIERYTPEYAADITTIPAHTIRRIAREFGEAARIGSTIIIDGKELPLRPAAVVYFKGAHGHNHAWLTSLAIELLVEVVGASNVPGGLLGCNPVCYGHPDTGLPRWTPRASKDGLLVPGLWWGGSEPGYAYSFYPPTEPRRPQWLHLQDLFPTALTSHLPVLTIPETERWGIPYTPEVLINYGANLLMSVGDPQVTAAALEKLYVISFNLWLDETTDFADLVLPDTCYLERLDPSPNVHNHHFPVGLGAWGWQIRQPVVPSIQGQRRHFCEVLLEVAERLEMTPDLYAVINHYYGLGPPYALRRDQRYTWEEIGDHIYRHYFGEAHGLKWFKEHGVLTWPKRVEEVYWKPFTEARVPIYFEWLKGIGEKIGTILNDLGITELNLSDFQPLPDWKPCCALEVQDPAYDLQAIYYRVAWHSFSMTYENPWLDELSAIERTCYCIAMHAETARRKGLRDGDLVWVEAAEAGRVKGRVRLIQGIHPEVVGIANNGGHWSPHMPIARDKGVFFEALMPLTWRHLDPVSVSIDCDARVRVVKVEDAAARAG
jgi:molybdopterin-containing oxidoreductase family molybdopterin binding subunit